MPKNSNPLSNLIPASCEINMKDFKVMFCRICGCRVRVWKSYRTSRSFGYRYGCVTELTEVPGLWHGRTELTELSGGYKKCCTRTPGILARGVQSLQKFRVRVRMSYRTHRISGYGYESLAELPEVPGIVARAYRTYRSSGQV